MDASRLYVTDFGNSTIRQIVVASGKVTTLAGSPGLTGFADGTAGTARFSNPALGIATDGTRLFVSDYGNHTIRTVVIASGVVSTLAGSPTVAGLVDGTGSVARFSHPEGITSDGKSLYIADSDFHAIRKLI